MKIIKDIFCTRGPKGEGVYSKKPQNKVWDRIKSVGIVVNAREGWRS